MIDKGNYDQICNDAVPLLRRLAKTPVYAIALSGSYGKGVPDAKSDFDFRVYFKSFADEEWSKVMKDFEDLMRKWRESGVILDTFWPRSIEDVNAELDRLVNGRGTPKPYGWTIWGYNMLTDIYNQVIVEDPYGIIQGWKDRLSVYPEALRKSLLKSHGDSLKYWRDDYHYKNKCDRSDYVFMASITARLINDIMQVIYALNRFYFPGDGLNLIFTKKFSIKPNRLEDRVAEILYPCCGQGQLQQQYDNTISLIDDVLSLINGND